jgi:hypothetical protein
MIFREGDIMRALILAFVLIAVTFGAFAQNLTEERIWKISSRKRSIFLDSGVFHYKSNTTGASISGVRNSVAAGRDYERLVIDLNSSGVPRLYGHISSADNKLRVDFFDTTVSGVPTQLKNSKYVKGVDFLAIDPKNVTMEIALKGKSSFDIFYLENPGRLVIDIR